MEPITLDDGAVLTVRPIAPDDVDRLGRMFERLSPTTIYRRFFSPIHEASPRMLMRLTNVDHDRREALVALDGDEIVAVARYDGQAGAIEAEIAVTVEDAWQHRGVGKRLARRLARSRSTTASNASSPRCSPTTARRSVSCTGSRRTHRCASWTATTRPSRHSRERADAAQRGLRRRLPRAARSRRRYTKRNPDHVSSTAHTLLSTRPCARPTSRTTFSVRSVATPAVFFGQAIHKPPAGSTARANESNRRSSSDESRREEHHDVLRAARLRPQAHTVG